MELTEKQKKGLEIALKKYNNGEKICVIAGYAGSGKTTLVKHIIEALPNIEPNLDVCYAAFTGKAAEVLRKKGNPNSTTLHKLLFYHRMTKNGTFITTPKDSIDYKVVVVDEISMASNTLIEALARHDVFVIALGDPGQLPPISEKENNHLLDNPDIFLDEVVRQAKDSGIINLSMKIRNGEPIKTFSSPDAIVLPWNALNAEMLQWADVILCGTNNMRTALNAKVRALKGYKGDFPQDGERLICLHNYWDNCSTTGNPLVNGSFCTVSNSVPFTLRYPKWSGPLTEVYAISAELKGEDGGEYGRLKIDKEAMNTGKSALPPTQAYKLMKSKKINYELPYEFTYGYALTTHRAQGSEWDNVLVIEENFPFDKEEHKKWLYTAVTRAAKKIIIIQKGR